MNDRTDQLVELLQERIAVLDGERGGLPANPGAEGRGFRRRRVRGLQRAPRPHRPDVIRSIHADYLAAGADIIETDTFGGTPLVLAEYGLAERAFEINRTAARIAREAAPPGPRPSGRAGSRAPWAPRTKAISVTGGVTFEELVEHYRVQALGLLEGGVDYLLLETVQDTRNVKAGLIAVRRALDERASSARLRLRHHRAHRDHAGGPDRRGLYASVEHAALLIVGLNCATGPEFMTDHLRTLAGMATLRVSCYPNAGLPDENGHYLETPEMLARQAARASPRRAGSTWWAAAAARTPAHIRALAGRRWRASARRRGPRHHRRFLSGIDFLEVDGEPPGPRRRAHQRHRQPRRSRSCIVAGRFEEAAEIARAQVKGGAQVIDVCLPGPRPGRAGRHGRPSSSGAAKKVRAPLMIDSTNAAVMERALTYCQGKAIINSVNLEDGEERFEKVVPLARPTARRWWWAPSTRTQGMAVTRERKLAVARRSYDLLTEKYGMPPEDLFFDPLVFPCGTGDANYLGSAVETIEGLRLIKAEFPDAKTDPGHLQRLLRPPRRRPRGPQLRLPLPRHPGRPRPRHREHREARSAIPSIPEEERRLAEDLLFDRGADPLAAFAAHFREGTPPHARRPPRPGTALERACPLHRRGRPRRASSRTSRRCGSRAVAPGHHQRPADGRHGRGGPPLQRQPAHRGRGAPVRRGHEGRRGPPRAAHGGARPPAAAGARSCWPRSRATSTTSARTWWTSSSPTTAIRWSTWASRCRPRQLVGAFRRTRPGRHRPLGTPGEERPPDGDHGRGPHAPRA